MALTNATKKTKDVAMVMRARVEPWHRTVAMLGVLFYVIGMLHSHVIVGRLLGYGATSPGKHFGIASAALKEPASLSEHYAYDEERTLQLYHAGQFDTS